MDSNERMDRLEADLAETAGTVKVLSQVTLAQSQKVSRHDEETHIREIAAQNEERLGVVIKMMDERIRSRGKDTQ